MPLGTPCQQLQHHDVRMPCSPKPETMEPSCRPEPAQPPTEAQLPWQDNFLGFAGGSLNWDPPILLVRVGWREEVRLRPSVVRQGSRSRHCGAWGIQSTGSYSTEPVEKSTRKHLLRFRAHWMSFKVGFNSDTSWFPGSSLSQSMRSLERLGCFRH